MLIKNTSQYTSQFSKVIFDDISNIARIVNTLLRYQLTKIKCVPIRMSI